MKRLSTLLLIAASAFAQSTPAPQSPPAPAKKAAPAAPAKKEAAPPEPERDPGLYTIMNTSMGKITAQLFEKETPGTVANFVALAKGTKSYKNKAGAMVKGPYFTNLLFHRVIPGFMIQTGDIAGTGSSDCGFTIKDEIVPTLKYDKAGPSRTGAPGFAEHGRLPVLHHGCAVPLAERPVHDFRTGGGRPGHRRQDCGSAARQQRQAAHSGAGW